MFRDPWNIEGYCAWEGTCLWIYKPQEAYLDSQDSVRASCRIASALNLDQIWSEYEGTHTSIGKKTPRPEKASLYCKNSSKVSHASNRFVSIIVVASSRMPYPNHLSLPPWYYSPSTIYSSYHICPCPFQHPLQLLPFTISCPSPLHHRARNAAALIPITLNALCLSTRTSLRLDDAADC